MNVGDLVTHDYHDGVGMIIAQVGVVDRWIVYWMEEQIKEAHWGSSLCPIT